MTAGLNREFHFDTGNLRRAIGDLACTLQDHIYARAFGIAYPAPDFAIFWHDVRYIAAFDNRIVHTHRRLDMFAQQIDAVREGFDAIHGATPIPRIERRVGGFAFELDDEIHKSLSALHIRFGVS